MDSRNAVGNKAPNSSDVELIVALARDAAYMGHLTARFLERLGLVPRGKRSTLEPVALPREFLLELGGVIRVGIWEAAGLSDRLGQDLPRAKHALAELFARTAGERTSDLGNGSCFGTFQLVCRIVIDRLAWAGREEIGADVVLGDVDDADLLHAIADLLWANRHLATETE
jgi:hypothetical protein